MSLLTSLEDAHAKIKKLQHDGYKIGCHHGSFGSWERNTLMDGWDCMIAKGDTSRHLGLYFNARMAYLSVTDEDFNKVDFEVKFSQYPDMSLVVVAMEAIFGVLTSSADLIIHGTEDELTNELMQSIHNAVSEKLAEDGVTDCSYTGTLFNSRPNAA